jgi:hypothetical protein
MHPTAEEYWKAKEAKPTYWYYLILLLAIIGGFLCGTL